MKKKFLAVLLLAVLLAMSMAQAAWAATVASGECGAEGDNVTWVLDDAGTLTISGTGEMADFGYVEHSPWYERRKDIEKVIIENGIVTIGNMSFAQCTSLINVTMPNTITRIGEGTFQGCEKLVEIDIPNSVTDIGSGAFWSCRGLVNITIPDNVTEIKINTFNDCINLTNIKLPEKLKKIELYSLGGCLSLKELAIPDSVTTIEATFFSCYNLQAINVVGSNKYFCSENGVLFNKDKTKILAYPAGKSSTLYYIPETVITIGDNAFGRCRNIINIYIPESVNNIGALAFEGCRNLSNVYYAGTEEEWKQIEIQEEENEYLLNATIHYNSSAEIPTVPVTSLTLNRSEISLLAGGTAQLQATVSENASNKNVTWTSSNIAVATVDETGKVTAVSAGKAVVTATAADGSGQKAECKVTVTGTAAPAEAIYTITFDTDGGTMAGPSVMQVTKETKVTMPTAEKSGYNFKYWQDVANTSQTYAANNVYSFAADTELKALWERRSSGGSSGGGGSRPATKPGTTTETKPSTESNKPGNSGSKEITAANIGTVFGDVQNNAWYSEAIAYVYNKGMMNGTEKGFEPNSATTRAMIVTMLHRLNGTPAAGVAGFADVAGGQWYSEAVAWAAANGVVNGYRDTKFAPNEEITREQLAAILYRYAQFKGLDVSAKGDLSGFADGAAVSGWAQEAMQWAVGAGLLNGNADGTLAPAAGATRAEVAMILMRFEGAVK